MYHEIFVLYLSKHSFCIFLKCSFNWVSCILSDTLTPSISVAPLWCQEASQMENIRNQAPDIPPDPAHPEAVLTSGNGSPALLTVQSKITAAILTPFPHITANVSSYSVGSNLKCCTFRIGPFLVASVSYSLFPSTRSPCFCLCPPSVCFQNSHQNA